MQPLVPGLKVLNFVFVSGLINIHIHLKYQLNDCFSFMPTHSVIHELFFLCLLFAFISINIFQFMKHK